MKLRSQTALTVGGVLAVGMLLLAGVSFHVMRRVLLRLESEQCQRNAERVEQAMTERWLGLSSSAADWGAWDEAYRFAGGENDGFVEANMDAGSLALLRVNLVAVFDSTGGCRVARALDWRTGRGMPAPAELCEKLKSSGLLSADMPKGGGKAVIVLDGVPCLMASRPIVTSHQEGPVRGAMLMGRRLDAEEIKSIGRSLNVELTAWPVEGASLPAEAAEALEEMGAGMPAPVRVLDAGRVAAFGLVRAGNGRPGLVLCVAVPRDIYGGGLHLTFVFMGILGVLGVGATIAGVLVVNRFVAAPLERLESQVRVVSPNMQGPIHSAPGDSEEIGGLAASLNEMVARLAAAQEAVEQSRRKYADLIEHLFSGVAVCEAVDDGRDFVLRDVNAAGVRISRLSRSDAVGRRLLEVLPGAAEMGLMEAMRQVWKSGEPRLLPEALYRDARFSYWLEHHLYKVPSGDVVVVYQDVTARHEAEDLLRRQLTFLETLLDTIPNPVFFKDREGRFLGCNRAYLEFMQRPRGEVVGRTVVEIGPTAVAQAQRAKDEELFAHPGADSYECRVERGTGESREVVFSRATFADEQGRVAGLVGVISDVTDQRRMEVELRRRQRLASIGVLAGGVAHEINNPLNGIINFAQLIADGLSAEHPLAAHAAEIIKEAERVAATVRQLLAFAQQGGQQASPARVADIVAGVLTLERSALRAAGVEVDAALPMNLPSVLCRSQQVQQVLVNLIGNARESLVARYPRSDPEKRIRISAAVADRRGERRLEIAVEDRGAGIPAELLPHVCDPFFTTGDRTRHAGLGLAVSHGIVTEHGGRLNIESEEGRGTRVTFDLPIAEE